MIILKIDNYLKKEDNYLLIKKIELIQFPFAITLFPVCLVYAHNDIVNDRFFIFIKITKEDIQICKQLTIFEVNS